MFSHYSVRSSGFHDQKLILVFALKSALLQYFCIGQEEKQEMRIMYDELREVRELFNE